MKRTLLYTLLDAIESAPADAAALVDDQQQLTYGQLRCRARKIGDWLHARHGGGQYFVLKAPSTVDFVTTMLGVMYGGSTPIPVAPDAPDDTIETIREKSQAARVLDPLGEADYATAVEADYRDLSRPAVVMFTSGTTGSPKGVVVSYENLMHSCGAISDYLDYPTYRSAAVVLPLHYSYALLSQVCCQLSVGGRIRLFPTLRNPLKVSREIEALGLETFCGVPSTYHVLSEFHRLSRIEMPSVRVLCSAGAAMNHAQLGTIREMFPEATFFNNYGMTEAAPRIAYIRDDDPRFHEPTCGRAMAGVDVKIVDPTTHESLPDGETGMLAVAGPNITTGYLNDPERTGRAFTADGYLLSQDMATMDGPYIFIRGRYDDIFNVAGEKVSPLEIERVLNHLPTVDRSAVVGVPDERRGMVPVAFLKLSRPATRREIVDDLRGRLQAIKIPQRFFEVRDFPTTPNGKLRRKELSTDDTHYVIREIK